MKVTESHTLVAYENWLQVMTAMLCVVLLHIAGMNPSSPGTVIFLVKGVGCALQWDHLSPTDCLNALNAKRRISEIWFLLDNDA